MKPKVSLITPSYNRSDLIDQTRDSILNQTYSDWEWVIVEDGSTDNSWEKIQDYARKDQRIKVFKRQEEPKGAARCRNIAVENSTGKYLLFIDTDDLLAPFCLEQRVMAMEQNPDLDFSIFPMLLFKESPFDLGLLWNIDKETDEIERLLFHDPICQGTGTLWKRQSFIQIGMWDETLKVWQDIELHLRSHLSDLVYRKFMKHKPDVFIRITENSLSRGDYHSMPKLKSRMKIFTTVLESIRRKKLIQYESGLRFMGIGIWLNTIRSASFRDASILLDTLKLSQVVKDNEYWLLRSYALLRRLRLHKIGSMEKGFQRRIREYIPGETSSLGKVRYENN